jgi:hypothetical protein
MLDKDSLAKRMSVDIDPLDACIVYYATDEHSVETVGNIHHGWVTTSYPKPKICLNDKEFNAWKSGYIQDVGSVYAATVEDAVIDFESYCIGNVAASDILVSVETDLDNNIIWQHGAPYSGENSSSLEEPFNVISFIDNGTRQQYKSGFVREHNNLKRRVDLIHIPSLYRVADRFSEGAHKYGERNYLKADLSNLDEVARFKAGALRHVLSWMNGETDEDHFAGAVCNLFMLEELRYERCDNSSSS